MIFVSKFLKNNFDKFISNERKFDNTFVSHRVCGLVAGIIWVANLVFYKNVTHKQGG